MERSDEPFGQVVAGLLATQRMFGSKKPANGSVQFVRLHLFCKEAPAHGGGLQSALSGHRFKKCNCLASTTQYPIPVSSLRNSVESEAFALVFQKHSYSVAPLAATCHDPSLRRHLFTSTELRLAHDSWKYSKHSGLLCCSKRCHSRAPVTPHATRRTTKLQ